MNKPLDYLNAAVAIAEAMCDTSTDGAYNESEHLLALPINGAMMFYVDDMAYFELAARGVSDTRVIMRTLERDAPRVEWERGR